MTESSPAGTATIDLGYRLTNDLFAEPHKSLAKVRQAMVDYRQTIEQAFLQDVPVKTLVHSYSGFIDELLNRIWQHYLQGSRHEGIALIAVGGYGRGELQPDSDIDLLILLEQDDHEVYRDALEGLLVFLWDIGLDIGHSVRSVAECISEARQDITIATTLMEARLLQGPEALYQRLRDETGPEHIWPGPEFFKAKWQEQQQRYKKYNDTAYNLEPNVKEGPGGLRDIQMIGWVAKRHFGVDTLDQLVEHNFLQEQEYQALIDGQEFLWRVRFGLHIFAGRREDKTSFSACKRSRNALIA